MSIPKNSKSQEFCDLNENQNTPPDRLTFPLTPPPTSERPQISTAFAVHHAMTIFSDLRGRRCPSPQTETVTLPRDQYSELLKKLENDQPVWDYALDKVRWNYNPSTGLLEIRMPTPVHDFFATSVAGEISKLLERLAEQGNSASEFAAKISNGGSSRIFLRDGTTEDGQQADSSNFLQRQPDAQFQHCDAVYPGVVLEVSYSQRGENLKKAANDYILHSNGDIKAVIGIDVNYGGTKESTISLWRPSYTREAGEELDILDVQQEIEYQPFRAADGTPVNQAERIRLNLRDFATDEISDIYEPLELCISYEKLANLLDRAEKMHLARELGPGGRSIKSNRKTKKRRRSSSPTDRLKTDDETELTHQENKAAEREAVADPDFSLRISRRRRN